MLLIYRVFVTDNQNVAMLVDTLYYWNVDFLILRKGAAVC